MTEPSTPPDQRLADCEDALATVEAAYDRDVPASTPTDREAALREAVLALPTFGRYKVDMDGDRAVMLADVLAVIATPAAEPAESADGLDVERLAEAIATAADNAWPVSLVVSGSQRPLAKLVAAEYARLGEPR